MFGDPRSRFFIRVLAVVNVRECYAVSSLRSWLTTTVASASSPTSAPHPLQPVARPTSRGPAHPSRTKCSGPTCTSGPWLGSHPSGRTGLLISSVISRSEEHTSELQSLMRISYAIFCLKKKNKSKDGVNKPFQQLDKTIPL